MDFWPDFDQKIGYPKKFGYPHYGLYQPNLDCFLLITDDWHQSIDIKNINISRYPLFIFQLDEAENYKANLIDNLCCEHWTVTPGCFDFVKTHWSYPILTQQLISTTPTNRFNLDFSKEKLWLQYVWHWIRFTQWIFERDTWYHQKQLISELKLFDFVDYDSKIDCYNAFKQFIYKTLLLENSIALCNQTILDFFSKNSELEILYLIYTGKT